MSAKCVYCHGASGEQMSGEHVISRTVLKAIGGEEIHNVTRLPNGKFLTDHEQIIKDVCVPCNNSLSPYDVAGRELVLELDPLLDMTGCRLAINRERLGWVVKTHLNLVRMIRDKETQRAYEIDAGLLDALRNHQHLPQDRFQLLVEGWQTDQALWDVSDGKNIPYFGYKSVRSCFGRWLPRVLGTL